MSFLVLTKNCQPLTKIVDIRKITADLEIVAKVTEKSDIRTSKNGQYAFVVLSDGQQIKLTVFGKKSSIDNLKKCN